MRLRREKQEKSKKIACVYLTDEKNQVLFTGKIEDICIAEEMVIELSIAYFNDPSPCYIHRGAVLSRVFLELEEALPEQGQLRVEELPEHLRRCIAHYGASAISRAREV